MLRKSDIDGLQALSTSVTPGAALLCVHGYGDHGEVFAPMFETPLTGQFRLIAPDLPGFGTSPPDSACTTIDEYARRLSRLADGLGDHIAVGLVGHSLGAAIAEVMARQLGRRCLGLLSIEGNLTQKDAYFSGQAVKWERPDKFKAHLLKGTRNMANFKPELARYADALEMADAAALWRLGKDAFACSRNDRLGERYRALRCPTLYYWGAKTTPAPTRAYLTTHRLAAAEYVDAGHWPTIDAPDATAQAIAAFFERNAGQQS